jgi:hypothetical protein
VAEDAPTEAGDVEVVVDVGEVVPRLATTVVR